MMRYSSGFASPTPGVTKFLIAIIATYILFALFGRSQLGMLLYDSLLLDPQKTIYSFELWRLVSYAFLHSLSSPMHVIFNALLLYLIGPQLESQWGEKRFILFAALAVLCGGISVLLSFLLGLSNAYVVGFSSVTIGLLIAWGLSFPEHNIYFFGILPLNGQQLVYVTIGLEILYAVSSSSISSAAHFGGIAAGFLFTKFKNFKNFKKNRRWPS